MLLQRALLLSAAVFNGLASANTATTGRTDTIVLATSSRGCSYAYGSGGVAPTPVPTMSTTETALSSFLTDSTVTEPSTIIVTANTTSTALTHTSTTSIVVTDTTTLPTYTSTFVATSTIATITAVETVCAGGASPSTVTEYTGTYEPVSGQVTNLALTYPTLAFCTTTFVVTGEVIPTVKSGAVTKTVTPVTTAAGAPTVISTSTIHNNLVSTWLTTVSTVLTSYVPAATTATTTISCGETVTKTMAAQCAPSNLISAIGDAGILTNKYANGTGSADLRGLDPSTCCQTCLDNEGCGGMMVQGENCSLFYKSDQNGEPVCDVSVFTYSAETYEAPGQGLIVQNGCGSVDYAPL
ncbi:hypothetical protein GGR50DRAFT_94095 [Xylaria sp. CBS 124048]|nr:hypothetical protein GGR50DRAFT_94095 [Xylaria sp. CBS 124048]